METKVDVIRDALRIYEWLVGKAARGEDVYVSNNDLKGLIHLSLSANAPAQPADEPKQEALRRQNSV